MPLRSPACVPVPHPPPNALRGPLPLRFLPATLGAVCTLADALGAVLVLVPHTGCVCTACARARRAEGPGGGVVVMCVCVCLRSGVRRRSVRPLRPCTCTRHSFAAK